MEFSYLLLVIECLAFVAVLILKPIFIFQIQDSMRLMDPRFFLAILFADIIYFSMLQKGKGVSKRCCAQNLSNEWNVEDCDNRD
jgi:hypothetical protein